MQPGNQFDMFPDLPATGHKQSRRKPATLERNKVNHEIAKDRYYYHRRLDRSLFKLDGDKRIITCKFHCTSIEDIPASTRSYGGEPTGQRHYIEQLVKLGYNVHYNLMYVEPNAFELIEISGNPIIRGNPPLIAEACYGLQVGQKVTQVGVPAKSGKETSSSHIDHYEPWIEYRGIFEHDHERYMAFLLPPDGVTTREHFIKDRTVVTGTFYAVYMLFNGDLLKPSKRSNNTYLYRGKFKLYQE